MPFVTNNGARLYWRIDGRPADPPLMLINSLGADHAVWDPVMPALTERFQVIRMDNRGHAGSDASPGDYSMAMLRDDVLAVADAAGADRFHYCGLSIGGMIGMQLAATHPERLLRMVLSNTSATTDPASFASRIATVRAGGMAAVADGVIGRWFLPQTIARDTPMVATARRTLMSLDPEGYISCCTAIRDMALTPMLPGIRVPTLVIAGTHDQSTSPEQGRLIATAIPGACYLEFPVAHFTHPEQPEAFVSALTAFLIDERKPAGAL